MKKIPTLFVREFESENSHKFTITDKVTPGLEYVLSKEFGCIPTLKYDGSACAIIDGKFYKRYDAKKGKPIPEGAIKCQEEPDPITGHLPCWVRCDRNNPADKWYWEALDNTAYILEDESYDGTYEAMGPHFQGNPDNMSRDKLRPHGEAIIYELKGKDLTFDIIKEWLHENPAEGIVWWKDQQPICKIKRTDFGFSWPYKKED